MEKIEAKRFSRPDEVRPFAGHGKVELLKFGEGTVGKVIFEPGWKWSQDVKPIAQTDSCQSAHSGILLEGRMHFEMDDGQVLEVWPQDVVFIPPGHDAWVVGDVPCVMLDFTGMESYALPQQAAAGRQGFRDEQPGIH